MKQEEVETICDKLYAIRDAVNHMGMLYALPMVRDLYEMILVKVADKKDAGCKLNCEVDNAVE